MILRDATADDAVALAAFDVGGPPTAWLDEVTEIVNGLISWQHDHEHQELDRRVIVAEARGEIVAVGAHERIEHDTLGPLREHCYVMVIAVRADHRRTVDRWRAEVLAYHRTGGASNGPTEAVNLLIEKIRRIGRGYRNYDNYRRRLLLRCGIQWTTVPTYRIRGRNPALAA